MMRFCLFCSNFIYRNIQGDSKSAVLTMNILYLKIWNRCKMYGILHWPVSHPSTKFQDKLWYPYFKFKRKAVYLFGGSAHWVQTWSLQGNGTLNRLPQRGCISVGWTGSKHLKSCLDKNTMGFFHWILEYYKNLTYYVTVIWQLSS